MTINNTTNAVAGNDSSKVYSVKVNWFQKEIDDPDRTWSFIEKQGHVVKFLHNRFQWYNYPRISKTGDFPLHLDIEVSARCDLACPMCPRRHTDISDYNHMSFDLFKKIVDEAAENNLFSVRLSWRGESLTNPECMEFIRYIKVVKKIPNVSFLTNGRKLNEKNCREFVEYGLDYISFSIDGVDKIYDIIRKPTKFDDVYSNIQMLKRIRDDAGKSRPQIRISGLWPAIAQDPENYFKKMTAVSDKIVSNPIKDYRVTPETKFVPNYVCQYPWERLFIGYDGRTQPCSNSIERLYVGDVSKTSVKEVWQGMHLSMIRKDHTEGKVDNYFACSRCSYRVQEDFDSQFEKDWSGWDPKVLSEFADDEDVERQEISEQLAAKTRAEEAEYEAKMAGLALGKE